MSYSSHSPVRPQKNRVFFEVTFQNSCIYWSFTEISGDEWKYGKNIRSHIVPIYTFLVSKIVKLWFAKGYIL